MTAALTINGRTLTKFTCKCGCKCEQFLTPETPKLCMNCRDDEDRQKNGWRPENSRD